MALLEEPRAEFSEHDTVLHLLLGLVSVSRRLERLLPAPPSQVPGEPPVMLPSADERQVLLLLGVVSLRRTLMSALTPLRDSAEAAGQPSPPDAAPEGFSPRELLR